MMLDPKFAKVVALWRSTSHAGEKANARARAEAIAAAAGMTFDDALAHLEKPAAPPSPLGSIFAGFDDFMEKEEPGYKARCAAEKAERERQRLERRAAILDRFGSEQAALAPCEREVRLHKALAKWRQPCEPPHERWTCRVDGYDIIWPERMPAELRVAIEAAQPLPATLGEAFAEHGHWIARRQDLEDVLGPGNYGDSGLDLTVEMRLELIRSLVEHELPATTPTELRDRLRYFRDLDIIDKAEILNALVRDVEALAAQDHPSNVSTCAAPASHPSTRHDRDGHIRAALDADPSRSDRDIARACKCSPTTVGKTRRTMGLSDAVRSVHRGGQMYQASFTFGDSQ